MQLSWRFGVKKTPILMLLLIPVVLSGCAAATSSGLQAHAAGTYVFQTEKNIGAVYQKILSRTKGCYEGRGGETTVVVKSTMAADGNSATLTVFSESALRTDALVTIVMTARTGGGTTVTVLYAQKRFAPVARGVEDWIKNDSKACHRSRLLIECAC